MEWWNEIQLTFNTVNLNTNITFLLGPVYLLMLILTLINKYQNKMNEKNVIAGKHM